MLFKFRENDIMLSKLHFNYELMIHFLNALMVSACHSFKVMFFDLFAKLHAIKRNPSEFQTK